METKCLASAHEFYTQLEEFCRMLQDEFLSEFDRLSNVALSASAAQSFTERLLLCPTVEAARAAARKDLTGALSFIFAIEGIQQRLDKGRFNLPDKLPEYQTKFYFLACAVQDYLDSVQAQAA